MNDDPCRHPDIGDGRVPPRLCDLSQPRRRGSRHGPRRLELRAAHRRPSFWSALRITFGLFAVALVLQLVLGTALALLLNRFNVVRGLVRTAILSPFMLPPVVVGMIAIVVSIQGWGAPTGLSRPRPAAVPLACLADLVARGGGAHRHLAVDALRGPDRPGAAFSPCQDGSTRRPRSTAQSGSGASGTSLCRFSRSDTSDGGRSALGRSTAFLRRHLHHHAGRSGNATTTLNIYAYKLGFDFMDVGYARRP